MGGYTAIPWVAKRPSARAAEIPKRPKRHCSAETAVWGALQRRVAGGVGVGVGGWGGGRDLEGEDDDLVALGVALHAGVSVGLEAREGRERDLLLPRVLRADAAVSGTLPTLAVTLRNFRARIQQN